MARRLMNSPQERLPSTPVPAAGPPFQRWRNPPPDGSYDEFDNNIPPPGFIPGQQTPTPSLFGSSTPCQLPTLKTPTPTSGQQTPTPGLFRSSTPSPCHLPPLRTPTPTSGASYGFQHGFAGPPGLFMDDSSLSSVSSHAAVSPTPSQSRNGNSNGGSLGGKSCGVCGDRAKSFHFGGLCCDSCKAFFRRSVQNDAYKNFHCSYEGRCVINMSTRKSCQYCRLQRCFAIGMEKGWIMTEQERMLMMKQRAEKKRKQEEEQEMKRLHQIQQQEPLPSQLSPTAVPSLQQPAVEIPYEPDLSRMLEFLDQSEVDQIETLVKNYAISYAQVPYESGLKGMDIQRSGVQIINMFTTLIRRFACYATMLPDFQALPKADQTALLCGATLEMCLLRGALAFDPRNHRWPNSAMEMYRNAPTLHTMDVKKLVSNDLFDKHMKFIADVQKLQPDEPTIMLLLMIVLYTPERVQLQPQVAANVQRQQDHYSVLMKRYMNWRYGPHRAKTMYSRLLTKLSDLRELSDTHNQFHLNFANKEVTEIQKHLSVMNLNPYPTWNVLNPTGSTTGSTTSFSTTNAGSFSAPALSLAFKTTAGVGGQEAEQSSPGSSRSPTTSPNSLSWSGNQFGMPSADMIARSDQFSFTFGDSPLLGSIPRNLFRDSSFGVTLTPTSPTEPWGAGNLCSVVGEPVLEGAASTRLFQEEWRKMPGLDWPDAGALALVGGPTANMSVNDTFTAQQLEQFRVTLEQLTQCKDAQQLEQIKTVLGPELVTQFQQKMLGSPGEGTSTDEEAHDVLQVAAESFYPVEFAHGGRSYSSGGSNMAMALPSNGPSLSFAGFRRQHHDGQLPYKQNQAYKHKRALMSSVSSYSSSSSTPSPLAPAGSHSLSHSDYEDKLSLEADLYFPLLEAGSNSEELPEPSNVQTERHT